jgi:hypothetical protein
VWGILIVWEILSHHKYLEPFKRAARMECSEFLQAILSYSGHFTSDGDIPYLSSKLCLDFLQDTIIWRHLERDNTTDLSTRLKVLVQFPLQFLACGASGIVKIFRRSVGIPRRRGSIRHDRRRSFDEEQDRQRWRYGPCGFVS